MNLKFAPALLLAALVFGCKSNDTSATTAPSTPKSSQPSDAGSSAPKTQEVASGNLVGTWTSDDATVKDATIEFKSDGTMKMKGTAPDGTTLDVSMKYKVDGNKVTRTIVAAKMTASPKADEKTKKQIEQANKMANDPKSLSQAPADVSTIAWKDKDHFSITTAGGKSINMTRKS